MRAKNLNTMYRRRTVRPDSRAYRELRKFGPGGGMRRMRGGGNGIVLLSGAVIVAASFIIWWIFRGR